MLMRPLLILSNEQTAARDRIFDFLRGREQVFTTHGLAGVGKSTLLATVASVVPEAHVCAPTGKAAHVLRQKMGRDACTIHSLFYRLTSRSIDPQTRRRLLRFAKIHVPGALRGEVVLIDEASMISEWMARDLIASGAKLVLFGDPGQLVPIKGRQFFTDPNVTLTEVHRQAKKSAIIRQAHAVRRTGRYAADGPDFQLGDQPDEADYMAADTIITSLRKTRQKVNDKKRQLLGFAADTPQAGETVLCLQNAPEFGAFNGGTYRTLAPYNPKTGRMVVEVDGAEMVIPGCAFTRDDPSEDESRSTTFTFGYALTCHKAQGSEWGNVLIVDEYQGPAASARKHWLYTAITRASKGVLVVARP